jgi:pimeloyl-ACP methyl ester carboxylesterase
MRRAALALGLLATTMTTMTTDAQSAPAHSRTPPPARASYATVNGVRLYYELHGSGGTPLVLIHGGGSTIGTNFGRVLPLLARGRRVVAVEMQAHGHTRDVDRPFTFEQDADDVAALLDSLHIATADVLGFSNGGTTALQIGIRHPARVRRLVIASSNFRRDGMQEGFWDAMAKATFADMPQQFKDAYLAINPNDDRGVHALFERDSKRMLVFRDIPDESIRAIAAPTLVVAGDQDVIRPEHVLALARLLPHGRACILPGSHGSYLGEITTQNVSERALEAFVGLIEEFLTAR